MTVLISIFFAVALVAAILIAAHLFYRPPQLAGRSESLAAEASIDTALGRIALSSPPGTEGLSGVVPLLDGAEALAARIALVRGAEVALDVQYYIWRRDVTGLILLDELRRAADRGVRVRLLLDDNGIHGLDADLAALDGLPNFEVRLYNPFILRRPKMLGFAFDFVRLNRRMHNKSLTADGALSILGGRNIGDEYFGFGSGVQFTDTDLLVAGPTASDIGADFDRYWHSGSVHSVDRILHRPDAAALDRLAGDAESARESAEGQGYLAQLRESPFARRLLDGEPDFEWTAIRLVSDDPAKGLGKAATRDLLFPQLMTLIARPMRSIDLVSAYFVPGRRFTRRLVDLARDGVRVRILTNSQAATDVILVHSAYVRYRPHLLRAGIGLYELRPEHAARDERRRRGQVGSSRASLHSKTLSVDDERIFIGSFNFDPRSLLLNTEMGVLIDSPALAGTLSDAFANRFPQASYLPELGDDRSIAWRATAADGTETLHPSEPGTSRRSRLALRLLGLLPIEWLL